MLFCMGKTLKQYSEIGLCFNLTEGSYLVCPLLYIGFKYLRLGRYTPNSMLTGGILGLPQECFLFHSCWVHYRLVVFGLGVFGMARRHALVSLRHALVSLRHAAPSQRHAAPSQRHAAPSQRHAAPSQHHAAFYFIFLGSLLLVEKRWQARQILWRRVVPCITVSVGL